MVVVVIMTISSMGCENRFLPRLMPHSSWNPKQSKALRFCIELPARPVQPRRELWPDPDEDIRVCQCRRF
jgi:hypothetical protein